MQERHSDRERYFGESAETSRKYYIPYISAFLPSGKALGPGFKVLEIGCGEGGNLAPFAEAGCEVTGVDISSVRIEEARCFFLKSELRGTFIASDIFELTELHEQFDLIVVHDVIEHIGLKTEFMSGIKKYLNATGVIFIGFPAWQMPFGGHQQMARSKFVSHFPFIHLLPVPLYRRALKTSGEADSSIEWFLDTKRTRTTIEMFMRIARQTGYSVVDRRFYFINPHYETKFGMRPRKVLPFIAAIPWFRNFVTTSSFWILRKA